jgi:hypothetical protein
LSHELFIVNFNFLFYILKSATNQLSRDRGFTQSLSGKEVSGFSRSTSFTRSWHKSDKDYGTNKNSSLYRRVFLNQIVVTNENKEKVEELDDSDRTTNATMSPDSQINIKSNVEN